jgi:hypothetical protein
MDQSYKYNLSTLQNKLPLKHNLNRVSICIYRVITPTKFNNIYKPFLSYLLFKYNDKKEQFIFPFKYLKNKNPNTVADDLTKTITTHKLEKKGFLIHNNDIYYFYKDSNSTLEIDYIYRNQQLWWAIIDEICNHRKILFYNIHPSTYSIFYNNPTLLYLTDKSNKQIEVPIVSYHGSPLQFIPYIVSLGIRSNHSKFFGAFYYLGSIFKAAKLAIWTSNYKTRNILGKNISSDRGKHFEGGIIRYAVFLKNSRSILYRPSEPLNKIIKYLDTTSDDTKNIKIDKSSIWADTYDSLVISTIKYKNISGFFNIHTEYIIKNFYQQIPLSCHKIEIKNTPDIYDPLFTNYNIK